MRITFDVKEKIVGAFMVMMVILLVTIVVMVGRGKDWFGAYVTYYTVFDEAYNLSKNARVKLYKADIGNVRSVKPEGDKVKVELAILEDYAARIKVDSIATVESPTFIGSEYVSIRPGTPDAAPTGENGIIPSVAKTSLKDLLEEFEVEKTAKMVIKSVQNISEVVDHLRDPKGPLYSSLDDISKTMAHIETIMGNIKEGKGSLGGMVSSDELLEKIYEQLNQLSTILTSVRTAADDIKGATPDIADGLKEGVDTINRILSNIEEGSRDVPAITKTTRLGIREIRDGVEEIDKVVQSAQKNVLIRGNLPPEPKGENIAAEMRR